MRSVICLKGRPVAYLSALRGQGTKANVIFSVGQRRVRSDSSRAGPKKPSGTQSATATSMNVLQHEKRKKGKDIVPPNKRREAAVPAPWDGSPVAVPSEDDWSVQTRRPLTRAELEAQSDAPVRRKSRKAVSKRGEGIPMGDNGAQRLPHILQQRKRRNVERVRSEDADGVIFEQDTDSDVDSEDYDTSVESDEEDFPLPPTWAKEQRREKAWARLREAREHKEVPQPRGHPSDILDNASSSSSVSVRDGRSAVPAELEDTPPKATPANLELKPPEMHPLDLSTSEDLPVTLPAPPRSDFEWQWLSYIRTAVPVPRGWKVFGGRGDFLGIPSYGAMVSTQPPPTVPIGLSVTGYFGACNAKVLKHRSRQALAEFFTSYIMQQAAPPGPIDETTPRPDILDNWRHEVHPGVEGFGIEFVVPYSPPSFGKAGQGGMHFCVSIMVNEPEDIVYEVVFRAPERMWREAWAVHGEHMFDNTFVNWADSSPLKYM